LFDTPEKVLVHTSGAAGLVRMQHISDVPRRLRRRTFIYTLFFSRIQIRSIADAHNDSQAVIG
jgi:hypothetical protein